MKKCIFLFALLALMLIDNNKLVSQCPTYPPINWIGPITGTIDDGCEFMYTYCYCYDINLEYCISITSLQILPPCDENYYNNLYTGAIIRIRNKIIINILETLINNDWSELESQGNCPDSVIVRLFNKPACYWIKWEREEGTGIIKQVECQDRIPRDCNHAIVKLCWEWVTQNGILTKVYHMNRYWYPSIPNPPNPPPYPYQGYTPLENVWFCGPRYYEKPSCCDNCY